MPERQCLSAKLPRHYWPILVVMLLIAVAFGAGIGAAVGVNPYIAGSVVCGVFLLYEVYTLRREGY